MKYYHTDMKLKISFGKCFNKTCFVLQMVSIGPDLIDFYYWSFNFIQFECLKLAIFGMRLLEIDHFVESW